MNRKEISEKLYKEMKQIVTKYPKGVIEIPEMLYTKEFFPGGLGFTTKGDIEKQYKILVLAHDFDSVKNYYRYKKAGGNNNNTTLNNFEKMLQEIKEANIEECFLSNAIMGLRDDEKNIGEYKPFKDKEFLAQNKEFLRRQIELIQPKLIITLGKDSLEVLKKALSTELRNFGLVNSDKNIKAVKRNIIMGKFEFDLIALTHTTASHRQNNLSHRKYLKNGKTLNGEQAEIEMMKDYFYGKYD